MSDFQKRLKRHLRAELKKSGETAKGLSRRIGKQESYLGHYLSLKRNRNIGAVSLAQIARVLPVPDEMIAQAKREDEQRRKERWERFDKFRSKGWRHKPRKTNVDYVSELKADPPVYARAW